MKRTCMILPFMAAALWAQSDDAAYRRMMESREQVNAYLVKAARAITDRAAEEIRSPEVWEKLRARRQNEMRDMLGLLPWPKRTPLNVRITGKIDKGDYTIEKIAFESMPKFYVTGNLYVPKNRKGAAPAIIYVCGHAPSPYGSKTKYQRHGISFAKNGYVCFILDPIQIAETFALHHGIYSQGMYDWYSRGYTPAGPETWNAIRAIDYLETRPEVDKDRIGITGRSGGAAMSWFPAAVDPRIKVAVPVMGISTYAANVAANTQKGHCDCMFAINHLLHDMMHQGALIAPRPLMMGHGSKDSLFPVPGYTEFEQRVGALYKGYGKGEAFTNVVVDTGHADSDFLRERAIRWFDRFLMGTPDRKLDMAYTNAPDETLAVFPSGPPADAKNYLVHETFTTRPPSPPFKTVAAWETRRKQLIQDLKANVFAHLAKAEEIGPARISVRKAPQGREKVPGLLYIASDGEDDRAINLTLSQVQNAVRVVVRPIGIGEVPWDKTFGRDTLRNAMHVGQTVDSIRLAHVMEGVATLRRDPAVDPRKIMVMGAGVSGTLGLYAAILDPEVAQVMLIDPPVTHAQGPLFLNVMRYTDLPEAAALIAPRPLTFYARVPAQYEYARHIYGLYGKSGHFFRAMNIHRVLEGRYDHNFGSGY
ncbi:MAG TPA: acetylxylan esterase [Bryobacteraceae bacterium]|nr:acetylxylan esterase [Bryobacteraceae bacterium]